MNHNHPSCCCTDEMLMECNEVSVSGQIQEPIDRIIPKEKQSCCVRLNIDLHTYRKDKRRRQTNFCTFLKIVPTEMVVYILCENM